MDELTRLATRYVAAQAAWARRYPDGSPRAKDLDMFEEHQAHYIDELRVIADQLVAAVLGRATEDPPIQPFVWPTPQTCQACGAVFLIANKRKFCADPACQKARAMKAYRKDHQVAAYSTTKVCLRCGESFVTNRIEARFCSAACRGAYHRSQS